MNRNYKVIWNQSLNCFMAVAEYAKSRGKSSSSAVSSGSAVNTGTGSTHLLRLSALCIGLASAGFSMQASAIAACAEDNAAGAGVVDRVQCGTGANAAGSTSVAIGQNAQATGGQTVAIGGVGGGQATTASGDQSTAIGANTVSSGSSSIAIGGDDLNKASGTTENADGTVTVGAVNSGEVNTTFKKYSGGRDLVNTAAGMQYPNTESSGAASVAVGVQAVSSGALSTAFGTQANATGVASSAFGVSADASKEGSVAIGAGSKTDGSATKVDSQTVNGITFTGFDGASGFAGDVSDAGRQVSVGLIGNERQIKNVAPGEISASSTDAINGSQVFSVTNELVDNIRGAQATADAVADGTAGIVRQDTGTGPITVGAQTGGTSVDFTGTDGVRTLSGIANGNVAEGSTEAVTGDQLNTTNTNVTTAQTTANTANTTANSALTKANQGFNISAAGGADDNVQLGETVNFTNTDGNLIVTNTVDNGINYDLAENIGVNKITIGDTTNNTVLTSTAAGLDVGGDKITNLTNGTVAAGSSDAVTGDQLNTTNQNVAANRTDIDTNTSDIDDLASGRTGIVRQDADTSAIIVGAATGGTSVNFTGTDGVRTLSGLANGNVAEGSTEAVTGDQLNTTNTNVAANRTDIDINTGNITDNSNRSTGNLAALGGGAAYDAANDIYTAPSYLLDDGTNTGTNTTVNNVGDALGNLDTRTTTNTADINKGINVGDGATDNNFALGDTINVTGDSNLTSTTTTDGIQVSLNESVDLGVNGSFTAGNSALNNTGLIITDGPSVTNAGINAAGNKITNVNDGTDTGDAVNFGQLDAAAGAANTKTDALGNSTASNLGGGATYNATTGAVSAPSYLLDDGTNTGTNTTVNNVGDALDNLDGRTTTNTSDIDDINAGRTGIVRQDAGTGAITVGAQTGGTSVDFTNVDGDARQLSGVASAGDITLAANANNAVNAADVNTAVTGLTNTGLQFSGDSTTPFTRKLGEELKVRGGATEADLTENNIGVVTNGNDTLTVKLNKDINLGNDGSVTTGNTTTNNAGVRIDDGTGNITNMTATGTNVTDSINTSNYGANGFTATDGINSTTVGTGRISVSGVDNTDPLNPVSNNLVLDGNTGQISGVADATAADQAINKGQLDAIANAGNTKADALGTSTASNLGGTATYDSDTGTVSAPTYVLNNGNNDATTSDFNNVGDALGNLDGRTTTNTSDIDDINAGRTGIVRQDAGTGAITVGAQTGGTSVNFTNVDGDARQLTGVASAGDISLPANANTAVNAGDVNAAVTGLTNAGLNFQGDDGTLIDRNLGDTLRVTGSATGNLTTGNIGVVADGTDGLSVQLAENINLGNDGSVTTGNTTTNNAGVRIDDGTGNATTITTAGTSVVDAADNEADYTAASASLSDDLGNTNVSTALGNTITTGNNITTTTGTGTTVTDGTSTSSYGATGFNDTDATGNNGITVNQSGVSFIDGAGDTTGPSITADGIDAGDTILTNLADGVNANDAATKGQVDAVSDDLTDLNAGAVQYDRNADDSVNYDQVSLAGTQAITGTDANGNTVVTSGGTTVANVANGINADEAVNRGQLDSVQTGLTDTGLSFAGDSGNDVQRKLGETLSITGGSTATLSTGNIGVVANGTDGLSIQLAEAVDLGEDGSVTTGDTVVNNAGVSVDDGAGNATTITTTGTSVVDADGNEADYTAASTSLSDDLGNTNVSTATGNTITDLLGNETITSATGTNVTDGINTSNYGANGFTATDGINNTTVGTGRISVSGIDNTDPLNPVSNNLVLDGNTGQISGVADATAADQAINKGQLDAIANAGNTKADALGASTASNLGGGATYNATTGAVSAPSYTLDNGTNTGVNTTVNNVGAALTNLDGRTTTNTSDIDDINAGRTGIVRQNAGTGAITVGAQTNGNSVNFTGTDGVRTLSGLANGNVATGSTEAVTGDQLNTTNTNVTDNSNRSEGNLAALGGNAAYDTANNIYTAPSYLLDDGTNTSTNAPAFNNVGDALGNLDTRAASNTTEINKGINFGDGTTDNNFALSDTINVTGDSNITSTTTTGGVQVTLNDNINVNRVTAGNSTLNNAGVIIVDGPNNTVTLSGSGLNNGNNRITNLADGIAPNDAATFGQLTDTNNIATGNLSALGGDATYNAVTDTYNAPTYTLDDGNNDATTSDFNNVGDALGNLDGRTTANTSGLADLASGRTGLVRQDAGTGAITVGAQTNGNSVNFTGIDGIRTLSGLANGNVATGSTEAVTGDQLNSSAASIATVIGGNATNAGGIVTATNIGGTGVNTIDGAISSVKDAATKAKSTVTEGKNITVSETVNTDGSTDYEVRTKENLALTSVTTGNSVLNNDGLSITDGNNITIMTSAGTNVTDGTNTSNYGATGFSATDNAGNNGITVNRGGISFINGAGDTTGPIITAQGIDANDTKITNLAKGSVSSDAATFGQLTAVAGNISASGVQYDRNNDNTVNYDRVSFNGTQAVIGKDDSDNDIVISGGTTLTNVANGVNASDAVNKGQLDGATKVKIFDSNGGEVTINVAEQVANTSVDNDNLDSLFLTYDKTGQEVTDRLTIGQTVQKMNTEGVKFAHTNASDNGAGGVGITNDSSAGGFDSTAIGVNAIIKEGADSTVALGHDTEATETAKDSVVIGKGSKVSGASSVAIGDSSEANGTQSISIGTGNIVNGDNSGAFGDPSIINGNNSYSVGNDNTIDSDDTFVFGNNVTQTVEGSVVLGTGSAAITGAGIVGFGAASNAAIAATTSTTGAVAVGDAANSVYRQVTGVAAGTADSDAVNVSQLKAVSDELGNSNASLNNAAVQYDKNPDDTVNKGSITLGGAEGTTITNVANGVQASDAVNKGQLDNLGSGVAGIIGGDASYDAEGNLTANNIGGTGQGNISDAIAAVNQGNAQANEDIQANNEQITNNTGRLDAGISFGADNGDNISQSVGGNSGSIQFEGGNNITTSTANGGIQIGLDGNIEVDSVTTGNTVVNDNGVTIQNGPSMTAEGFNAANTVITGVEAGVNEKDAVNFGQLTALDKKLGDSVNALGYRIGEVEDNANAGISAAMAMSSLPQAYIPGKSMVGGGIASYNGESAVAVGVSKVSDNGRWVIKVNGTADTQGNAGGAVGAGFHF